jgi:hypothetical protein
VTVTPNPRTLGFTTAVSRPDGQTPCYTIDFAASLPGSSRGIIFRNADGTDIARGIVNAAGDVTLSCEAGNVVLEDGCVPLGPSACVPGACP